MSDILSLKKFRLLAPIGALDWEKEIHQEIWLDLSYPVDTAQAAQSDKLKDVIDYSELRRTIIDYVQSHRFQLIETLVDRLAAFLLEKYPFNWIRLKLTKPHAFGDIDGIEVSIERRHPKLGCAERSPE